ncbi:hypothetical protein HHL16_23605 [Pseudoflavitalea sp. G-6-1-2]|uniref:hypothetical protein n=1 Tax=Pseudoflavitalea sp. G-6-1-2 TaxID=2728841 RepID=UPI00146EDDF5|nr:hypothetical protein [Pseudoflavitalea sp. G-6-1-2]NML23887.1 hypothetical protein [Pseudoflavitalea sp. G-6-1-2]
MKKIINFIFLLLICWICQSCNSQETSSNEKNTAIKVVATDSIDIDNIYLKLSDNRPLGFIKISGEFVYAENGTDSTKYVARFVSDSIMKNITYTGYSNNKNDVLELGTIPINLRRKINPLAIEISRLQFAGKKYLVFAGKAQSASGSGTQITYFVLVELKSNDKLVKFWEFESRFGDIHSIIDFNKDGELDYIKIVNGKKADEYSLTVNNIKSGKQINNGFILLKHTGNDRFGVLQDSLLKKY